MKQYWNDFDRKHSSSSRDTHARTHIEGENESKRDRDLFSYMLSNPTERKTVCTKRKNKPRVEDAAGTKLYVNWQKKEERIKKKKRRDAFLRIVER